MECNQQVNIKNCTCTWKPCAKKGRCCECIIYHRKNGEIPGCLFPPAYERTYDRSIVNFIKAHQK